MIGLGIVLVFSVLGVVGSLTARTRLESGQFRGRGSQRTRQSVLWISVVGNLFALAVAIIGLSGHVVFSLVIMAALVMWVVRLINGVMVTGVTVGEQAVNIAVIGLGLVFVLWPGLPHWL